MGEDDERNKVNKRRNTDNNTFADQGSSNAGIVLNPRTNLLMMTQEKLPLVDREDPVLSENIFTYSEPSKVVFNERHVPMFTPNKLWMTDTTFRDGQQSLPPMTPKQISRIFKYLSVIGGPNGMIRQSEFFLYSEKDREALEKCRDLGLEFPEITGWVRANKKDFELVKQMGLKEVGILTSVSDYHTFLKFEKVESKNPRRAAIDKYLGIVKEALDMDILPRCHFEDITKADFYDFVVPFAHELMELSREADKPIKVRMCDTLGIAVPYPGASLPLSVPGIVYGLNWYAEIPSEHLEWHGHNDTGNVKINAVTAWLYGCSVANGTLFGIGERTGNAPLEQLALEYWRLKGENNGMDLSVLCEVAEYFEKELGIALPQNYPIVGKNAFATAAGVHIDGIDKGGEKTGNSGIMYLPMDPAIVGNQMKIIINDKSGTAGIAYKVNEILGLTNENKLGRYHPGVLEINKWVDEEYKLRSRASNISEAEIADKINEYNHLFK